VPGLTDTGISVFSGGVNMKDATRRGHRAAGSLLWGTLWAAVAFLLPPIGAGAATVTVTSAADNTTVDGAVTLREAITSIDNGADLNADVTAQRTGTYGASDTINFDIAGAGVHTITPTSTLPQITRAMLIDGYSQPGASVNTLAVGDNAVLLIEISGASSPGSTVFDIAGPAGGVTIRGFVINRTNQGRAVAIGTAAASANNTITGNFTGINPDGTTLPETAATAPGFLVSQGSGNTIGGTSPAARNIMGGNSCCGNSYIGLGSASSGTTVQGNYLGLDRNGTASLSDGGINGIAVFANGNTIGGTAPGAGNVIARCNNGIVVSGGAGGGLNNVIQGNRIGTNAAGTAALGNGTGIGTNNGGGMTTIGGSAAGAGNLISGNSAGIQVVDGATGYTIQGNRIGTDVTGTLPIPNGGNGIFISTGPHVIGGTNPGEGNTIAFNGQAGVSITGSSTVPILGNSIFSNGQLGISLSSTVPVPNDACDADTGANNLQNYPVLTTASSSGGSTNIQGTLNSTANTAFRIEFFSNASCDPSGNGEGQTFLGFTNVTTDGSCNASFNVTLPVAVSPQTRLTATATDPGNNTSEFSACTSLQAQYHTVTPCRVADTRGPAGAYGGPALAANADRTFVIGGQCGIPTTAQAVSFNYTITQPTDQGDLRSFPGGGSLPVVSTMNWRPGQTRANNAIIPLGPSGDVVIHVDQATGAVHFIIDVNGYFE
jgi:hypothetical protein